MSERQAIIDRINSELSDVSEDRKDIHKMTLETTAALLLPEVEHVVSFAKSLATDELRQAFIDMLSVYICRHCGKVLDPMDISNRVCHCTNDE